MKYKLIIVSVVVVVFVAAILLFVYQKRLSPATQPETQQSTQKNMNTDLQITFNGQEYHKGFTLPGGGDDFNSESYEWVTGAETVENWTSLVTTHKLSAKDSTALLSAEAYAQNVATMLTNQGALVLETSLINQDMDAFGIDPAYPPFLLVYLFNNNGLSEFNMQKIVQQADGSVFSIIYAERFPTKSEEEMKAYYDSKERTDKRIEVIKAKLPY